MWSFRTLAPLGAAVILGACGFQPLYGSYRGGESPAELAEIAIEPIADRTGQQLHNHLLDILSPEGRPEKARYVLRVTLRESIERLAAAKSELTTRANLRLTAGYSLREAGTGRPIIVGNKTVLSSYNILASDFATLRAEEDAKSRALREIGDDIRTRLAVYFVERRGAATAK